MEGLVDDARLRHAGSIVAGIERQVALCRVGLVTEMGIAPLDRADDILRVGIKQQLVGIEAMTADRIEGAIHPIAVDQPRASFGKIAVPDHVGLFVHQDALDLGAAIGIEQA